MPDIRFLMSRRSFAAAAAGLAATGCASQESAGPAELGIPAWVPNIRVTRDEFAAHIEPSAAADPARPGHMLTVCRVFEGARIGLAAYVSSDSGRSWQQGGLLPGLIPDFDGNAVVAFDGRGGGYAGGIVATSGPSRHGDVQVWRTEDGGRTFAPAVTAIAGGSGLADHPGLAIDRWSRDEPRPLYVTASLYGQARNGLVLSRSADGGATFDPPRYLPLAGGNTALAPVITTGPGGLVCVACLVPGGDGAVLQAVCSADNGQTFGSPVRIARVPRLAPSLGRVTMKGGPTIATAPGTELTFVAVTSFDENSGRSRVLVFSSADQGRTWTSMTAPADSASQIFLQPQLATDARGRIGLLVCALSVVTRRIDVLLYLARPGRRHFGVPLRVTSRSFDPVQALHTGDTRWLGNYQGMAVTADAFHPVWTDTRTGAAQIYTAAVHA